jgi:type II secretory pathway pseudopilin PulG
MKAFALPLIVLTLSGCSIQKGWQQARARQQAEVAQCRQNLQTIYAALQSYRKAHGDVPDWLSDLVPNYLPHSGVLTCPTCRRTGRYKSFGIDDPRMPVTYVYEFCDHAVPTNIYGGSRLTMKAWKNRLMGRVGQGIPIVRCHEHDPVLNLAFSGEIYESGTNWEELPRFREKISPDDLRPDPR